MHIPGAYAYVNVGNVFERLWLHYFRALGEVGHVNAGWRAQAEPAGN